MSWFKIIKEESAKDFVLNRAKTGTSMADALREFAQRFPDKTPPNIEEDIKRAKEMDIGFARLAESRKKLEELENRKNPYSR